MARKGWAAPTGPQSFYDAETGTGGSYEYGPSGYIEKTNLTGTMEQKRDRFRGLGDVAAQRQAAQADFALAQGNRADGLQARGQQMEAAGMLGEAARGNAPSRAAIMGNQAAGQTLEAALGASAGARGPGLAAAQAQSRGMMGGAQLQAQGQFAGMRAGEIADARGQYGNAFGAIRGGDYASQGLSQQQADAQAAAELAQRRLNQQGQMSWEQLGLNQEQMQVDSDLRRNQIQNNANQDAQANRDARDARNRSTVIAGFSAIGGAAGSDERMKQGVLSLSDAHAKQQAYALGRAHQWEQGKSGKPVEWAFDKPDDITDRGEMSGDRGRAKPAGGKAAGSTFAKAERIPLPEERPVMDAVNNVAGTAQRGFDAAVDSKANALAVDAIGYMSGGATPAGAQMVTPPMNRSMQTFQREPQVTASDERAKGGIASLYEAPGTERHWDRDVSAQPDVTSGASLSGPTPKYSSGIASAPKSAAKSAPRKMSDAELKKLGESMLASQSSAGSAQLNEGPSVKSDPMTDALATGLAPFEYEYKPEFGSAEQQQPGEKNVGPMAQDMASNPITGQAVKQGDNGMLYIDNAKSLKLSLAAAGHLAQKQRELEAEMARMKGGR